MIYTPAARSGFTTSGTAACVGRSPASVMSTFVVRFAFPSRERTCTKSHTIRRLFAAFALMVMCLCSCHESEPQRTIEPFLKIKAGMSKSEVAELIPFEPVGSGGSGIAQDYYQLSDGTIVSVFWTQGVLFVQHDGKSLPEFALQLEAER